VLTKCVAENCVVEVVQWIVKQVALRLVWRKVAFNDFSQEGGIMTMEIPDSKVIMSKPNLDNTSDDNAIINLSCNVHTNNISQDQLKDILNTVMQAIRAESAKPTAESAKQTAESAKKFQPYRRNLENKQLCCRTNLKNKQLCKRQSLLS
jgi:hypothetical protein